MAEEQQPSEAEALTIIVGALLIGASVQATAKSLAPLLAVPASALLPVLALAMAKALPPRDATPTTAAGISDSREVAFRAQYVWAAVQRVMVGGDITDEQRYFNLHLDAGRKRHARAEEIDRLAKKYGPMLGWYAQMDPLTSEECREAHNRNFNAYVPPEIGYPGTVHPHCRCKPGKPHRTTLSVYDVKPHRRAA